MTLSGVVGRDSEAIKQVTLSKKEAAKWAASATDALAFHGMVAAVNSAVDDKDLIQDLGMTPGTDTSAVRGRVRFAYTSTVDGLTASYTAGPVSAAVGQCATLLETVCSRYGSCFEAGRSAGFVQSCVAAGEARAGCGKATSVTSAYGLCISSVGKASCDTLFPAGQPALPAICQGVIGFPASASPSSPGSAPTENPPPPTAAGIDDGSDAHRPSLPPEDAGFVDTRGGAGWADKCWVNIRAKKWGWAKAECDKAVSMKPASPTPMASIPVQPGSDREGGG